MDKTDVLLSMVLLQNSRSPYSELSKKFGLSVPTIHKRIQDLCDSGVIRGFRTRLSLEGLNGISTLIRGEFGAKSYDEILERLGRNEWIYWVAVSGGNHLIVGTYLRGLNELERCIRAVKSEAKMSDVIVGINAAFPVNSSGITGHSMSKLDYRIVRSMRFDSRKNVSDIARELDVSAKTVSRILSQMIDKRLIEITIEWYPDAQNDIISITDIDLSQSGNQNEAMVLLQNKHFPHVLFSWPFNNLPEKLMCMTWSSTMKDLNSLISELQREKSFDRVTPRIVYNGRMFDTWRDELPDKMLTNESH